MKLIQDNPYRIVGILSNASAKEIQSRKGKITAYAKVGKQITSEFDFPFLNPIEKDHNSIEKAFSAIQQSKESTATTMKAFISYALTLTIMLAAPGMALAGEKEGGKKPGWKVTAVDTTANTITVHSGKKGEPGEDKTYKVADAAITVEGASAKLADITVGMRAKITVGATPDTASAVDASTKKKKGEKKGDEGGAEE